MMVAGRVILGMGVGLEGGTVPVYVAETVERRIRGNLVSLYQFNIALGEVLGYAVAAIFIKVPGNWRYILGSSLVFSTIMFFGYDVSLCRLGKYRLLTEIACSFFAKVLAFSCTKAALLKLIKSGSESEA